MIETHRKKLKWVVEVAKEIVQSKGLNNKVGGSGELRECSYPHPSEQRGDLSHPQWTRGEHRTGDRFNPAPHVKRVNPLAQAYHTPLFVGLCCEYFSLFDAELQL